MPTVRRDSHNPTTIGSSMNSTLTRIASGLMVVAVAVGGGVAITTLAEAQTAAPGQPMPPHGPGSEGRGMPGGHMMREVERLKTSLKLSPSQAALWDRAQEQMKPPTDGREKMKARRDRMAAMLDDPDFDPRKLAADMDSADAERRAKMTAVRDAWFAVYASLNPVQRGQVREFLRSRLSQHHGMRERMGEWMGRMHGRDGEAGKPPMPPAPR